MHSEKKCLTLNLTNNKNYCIFNIYNNEQLKPRSFFLFNDIISNLSSHIFNYLTLKDLSILRCSSKLFLSKINKYYDLRLKIEINKIYEIQNINHEKTSIYMKNIDTQIPLNNDNLFDSDINSVVKEIKKLDRKIVTGIKGIKIISQKKDIIYAPFCIIFGKFNEKNKFEWKKIAENIMNDNKFYFKLSKLNYENMDDEKMLECFYYLNNDELKLNNVRRISPYMEKLIKWCRAVFSYHILVHPYKYRNEHSQIKINSDEYKYALYMDDMISKFYKFKYFLNKFEIMDISLGDYIFNINYQKKNLNDKTTENKIVTKNKNNHNNDEGDDEKRLIEEKIISNILSYLPIKQSYKFINLNKFWINCFKNSLYINCYELLKEIYDFKKFSYNKLYKDIPIIYENSILSDYFLMLDDILNSAIEPNISSLGINYIPFLSKEHIIYLKKLNYSNNPIFNSICKIFCILFNIKSEKKTEKGKVIVLYYKSIQLYAIKGTINKMIRCLNKLNLKENQLKLFYEEITKIFNYIYDNGINIQYKLKEIKYLNKGLYQLLLWEICLFEFLNEFNPFIFINYDNYFSKNKNNIDDIFHHVFKKDSQCEIEEKKKMVIYYIDELNFLKYNLIFKYHFHPLTWGSMSLAASYEFFKMAKNILNQEQIQLKNEDKFLFVYEEEKNNDNELEIELNNDNFDFKNKISSEYFKCKNNNRFFIGNEQLLFENFVEQIILKNKKYNKGIFNKIFLNNDKVILKNKINTNYGYFLTEQNNKKIINKIYNGHNNNSLTNLNLDTIDKRKNSSNKNSFYYHDINYSYDKNSNSNISKNLKRNKSNKTISKFKKDFLYFYQKNTKKEKKSNNYALINLKNIKLIETSYNYFLNNITKKKKVSKANKHYHYSINNLPNKIIILNLLLYLDMNTIHSLLKANKKFLICAKTHMFYRLLLLEKEKKILELENKKIINSIREKRDKFYKDYLFTKPNMSHAFSLINKLNAYDINELKTYFKKHNKTYEIIISPMLLLLGYEPQLNFFNLIQKLIMNKDFKNILADTDIDVIPYELFQKAEKIYEENIGIFNNDKIKYSKCLKNVINWIKGVLEYHRYKRFYSMSFYDYEILNETEQSFCIQMDLLEVKFYKIKYYVNEFCIIYKEEAYELMKQYNINPQ